MKKTLIYMAVMLMGLVSCQQKKFRTVYPEGDPQVSAEMLTPDVQYGRDSIRFCVTVTETETPLSTLSIKVIAGINVLASENVRTKDYAYTGSFTYAVPLKANMEEGAPVKVYLTATNVEGTSKDMILSGCTGHRPELSTMYIMPPTIEYKTIGKGTQMAKTGEVFRAEGLAYPKSFNFLLACVGTKFGRVDWTKPVFGMLGDELALITKEQFESGEAKEITISDDRYESIDTVTFDPLTFELSYGGKIAMPVTQLDVLNDLEENPSYITSTSVQKLYRGAKIYFAKDSEVELINATNTAHAVNADFMEYISGNTFKFLGETGMYYVSYKIAEDYLVVEPLYDLVYPDVMLMCGIGMCQPSYATHASTESGWGFDSPNQNFVCRTLSSKVYQVTVYMHNSAEDADHPGFGNVNFKFFHQHGWGGEEDGSTYQIIQPSEMNIVGSTEASNVGNWWAKSDKLFEGVYRIILDQNQMTTTIEKIR